MLQESFRHGWKLPSLLVFIVGKGQHTQGLPKLREAVVHLLRGELHMSVIDGAQLPPSGVMPSTMLTTYPPRPQPNSPTPGRRSPRQPLLNPGRLAVEGSSLLLWVRKTRDSKHKSASAILQSN